MRRIGSRSFVVLLASAVGACAPGGEGNRAGVGPVVTDSAGVEIVVNQMPPMGLPVYATLDSAADLDVGFVRGDPTSYLQNVRGVVTLANGELAVANGSTFQVRYYGPDGTWLGWMGDQGLDPGEYWELSRLGREMGDTLWAADYVLDRLTTFERGAGLLSTDTLPAGHSVAGRFGDGSFLVVPRWSEKLRDTAPTDDVGRDPARYLRWWPESGDTIGVGTFPHDEILVVKTDQGSKVGVPPFGRRTVRAVGPGRFYVGDQESFTIDSYDPDGTLRQSIRLEGLDLSLTPEQVEANRAEAGAETEDPEIADRFWAAAPESRPAYTRILLDAAGNLWVAEHVASLAPPRNWMVFTPDGVLQGVVTVPRYFVVQEIGLRYIVGVKTSAAGDQRVVRYPMTRVR